MTAHAAKLLAAQIDGSDPMCVGRRTVPMMRTRWLFLGLACGCGADDVPATAAPTEYAVVEGWPALDGTTVLGQVSGVGVDAADDVLVFRRAGRTWDGGPVADDPIEVPAIVRVDGATGAIIGSLGAGTFVVPHGLTVDSEDNLWVTDVGVHQVVKLDPSGTVLLTLGERGVAGDDEDHFDRPTDVAIGADGSIYVSDGYGNTRVVKFSAAGEYLFSWGSPGDAPGEFDVPHGIAVDPTGRVFVADRGNARVQAFDDTGAFLFTWQGEELGRPWSLTFDAAGFGYIVDGGDQVPEGEPERARVLKTDAEGHVLGSFGAYGHEPGHMVWPHDIAVDSTGALYVAEVHTGRRVQKFRSNKAD
jgi:peptidylamidoglycolate lyase